MIIRNAPLGTLTDDPAKLAAAIRKRIKERTGDSVYLAWAEHGDVFAQSITARAAQRIELHKPHLIIGLYTKAAKVEYIQADVEAMQMEMTA